MLRIGSFKEVWFVEEEYFSNKNALRKVAEGKIGR